MLQQNLSAKVSEDSKYLANFNYYVLIINESLILNQLMAIDCAVKN